MGKLGFFGGSVSAALVARHGDCAAINYLFLLRRMGRSEDGGPPLFEATAEAELEGRLAREQRRLADMEKELRLEIQMKVGLPFKTFVNIWIQVRIKIDVCAHGRWGGSREMWWLMGDVGAHLEMWVLIERCGGSLGDEVAHWQGCRSRPFWLEPGRIQDSGGGGGGL